MNHITRNAMILMAACAISTGVMGQKVYRCGSTYSQIPCADGGAAIEAQDARTKAQKAQADAVIRNDTATAQAMEKERLQQEAQVKHSVTKSKVTPADQKKPREAVESGQEKSVPVSSRLEAGKTSGTKSTKKEPEYFTAQTAAEKKKTASAPKK